MSNANSGSTQYDTWDFDVDLAHYILPRLKQLRKKIDHVPPRYINSQRTAKEAFLVWLDDIDLMIKSWEVIADGTNPNEFDMVGLRLFAENIIYLWE